MMQIANQQADLGQHFELVGDRMGAMQRQQMCLSHHLQAEGRDVSRQTILCQASTHVRDYHMFVPTPVATHRMPPTHVCMN